MFTLGFLSSLLPIEERLLADQKLTTILFIYLPYNLNYCINSKIYFYSPTATGGQAWGPEGTSQGRFDNSAGKHNGGQFHPTGSYVILN